MRTIAIRVYTRDIRWGVVSRRFAMRLLSVASVVGLLLVSCLGNARAADPYDGEWTGSATVAKNGRCRNAQVTMTVSDNLVLGQAKFDADSKSIRGTVQPDGIVGATIGFQHLTGKFIDDRFEGRLQGSECTWTLLLRRPRARGPSSVTPLLRFASRVPMFVRSARAAPLHVRFAVARWARASPVESICLNLPSWPAQSYRSAA
jgi:hypothetical protein